MVLPVENIALKMIKEPYILMEKQTIAKIRNQLTVPRTLRKKRHISRGHCIVVANQIASL